MDGALGMFDGFRLIFIHPCQDTGEVARDLLTHLGNQFGSLGRDANHDLTAIFGSVHTLNVGQLLQAIDQTGGGCGRVTHLFRDVGHGQIIFAGKIGEEEELRERDVTFVEFCGQVQDAASLCEQDEVS